MRQWAGWNWTELHERGWHTEDCQPSLPLGSRACYNRESQKRAEEYRWGGESLCWSHLQGYRLRTLYQSHYRLKHHSQRSTVCSQKKCYWQLWSPQDYVYHKQSLFHQSIRAEWIGMCLSGKVGLEIDQNQGCGRLYQYWSRVPNQREWQLLSLHYHVWAEGRESLILQVLGLKNHVFLDIDEILTSIRR